MINHAIALLGLALVASAAHADGDYISPTDDRFRDAEDDGEITDIDEWV